MHQNNDFSVLLQGISSLSKAINRQLKTANRKVIGRSGKEVTSQVKEWYGVTMSVNGEYSFDYTAAGFTEILHVDPKAVYDAASFNDQAIATINEVSLTSMRGKVVKGASQIFKSDGIMQGPVALVMIKVLGI